MYVFLGLSYLINTAKAALSITLASIILNYLKVLWPKLKLFLLVFVHSWAQTESCDVELELELEQTHQDVTFPVSIIYKDDDTLAHPSVS